MPSTKLLTSQFIISIFSQNQVLRSFVIKILAIPSHKPRWLAITVSALLVLTTLFEATPRASAMILMPPGPTLALEATQPQFITQRTVTATTPAGWESSYFANYYEYGY